MLRNLVLSGMIAIPLQTPQGWQVLKYKGIEANTVSFSKEGMSISVKKSASPIIFPLEKKLIVHKIKGLCSFNSMSCGFS